MQFSFKWPMSLQYQHSRSGLMIWSDPCASWEGPAFPTMVYLCIHWFCMPVFLVGWDFIFRLLATAWLIELTNILGSNSLLSCSFLSLKAVNLGLLSINLILSGVFQQLFFYWICTYLIEVSVNSKLWLQKVCLPGVTSKYCNKAPRT